MPFGLDANDLNLVDYQAEFNDKLVVLLDQTIPELAYRVRSVSETRLRDKYK